MPECPGRVQPLDNARERAEYDGPGWSWSAVLIGRGRQSAVLIGRGRQRGVGGTANHKGMCHPVVTHDWLAKESARTNQ